MAGDSAVKTKPYEKRFFLHDCRFFQIENVSENGDLEVRITGKNGEYVPVANFQYHLFGESNEDFINVSRELLRWSEEKNNKNWLLRGYYLYRSCRGKIDPYQTWIKIRTRAGIDSDEYDVKEGEVPCN